MYVSVIAYCAKNVKIRAQRIMMPSPKGSGDSLKWIPLAKFGKMCASKRKIRVRDYSTLNKKNESMVILKRKRGLFLKECEESM